MRAHGRAMGLGPEGAFLALSWEWMSSRWEKGRIQESGLVIWRRSPLKARPDTDIQKRDLCSEPGWSDRMRPRKRVPPVELSYRGLWADRML